MLLPEITMAHHGNNNASWHGNHSVNGEDDDFYNIKFRMYAILTNPHDLLAITIGFIAITLNILVLCTLIRGNAHLTSHYRLIISLAVSDVVVGGSVMLHTLNKALNPVYRLGGFHFQTERLISKCTYLGLKALNNTGLIITLLNLMAMAGDHYLAIMKPLKHPILMRKPRVIGIISALWGVSIILGFSDFFSAIHIYRLNYEEYGYNYCEQVFLTSYTEEYAILTVSPICLTVMIFIYIKIYLKIKHHQRPGAHAYEKKGLHKTKKALVTTLLNLLTFIVTWLPLCLFQVSLLIKVRIHPQDVQQRAGLYNEVNKYLVDLLMVNAIADSIIYTVRIKEVRFRVLRLFSCFGCISSNLHERGSSYQESSYSISNARITRQRRSTTSFAHSEKELLGTESVTQL